MTRDTYRSRVPGARHRYSMAGNEFSIDSAMPEVVAVAGEPVTFSTAPTSLLQVLAVEIAEADLMGVFKVIGTEPDSKLVQQVLLPALKKNPRIISALTLTWTADLSAAVSDALAAAAEIAESEPEYVAEPDRDLHLSGYQP